MTEKKPRTLKDVSVSANLSLITVSRALRKPETVRVETRAKVQEAIKKVGYLPNLTARLAGVQSLKHGWSGRTLPAQFAVRGPGRGIDGSPYPARPPIAHGCQQPGD